MSRALLLVALIGCDAAIDRDYFAHPIGASFSPESGRSTGGEPVTILGEGLERVTAVTLGGVKAEIVEQSESSLRILTPAHTIGSAILVLESDRPFSFEPPYRYLPSRIQFEAERLHPVPGRVVAAGELDGDPELEVVVLELRTVDTWGSAVVRIGAPGGPLEPVFEIPSFTPLPDDTGLHAVDLDRDGLDDLILYTWSWSDTLHDVHVLMNRGGGVFEGGMIADDLELKEGDFFSGDLDADGAIDFGWMGAELMVFWSRGDGTFEPPTTTSIWLEAGERRKTLASTFADGGLFAVNLDAEQAVRVRFVEPRIAVINRAPYHSDLEVVALSGVDLVLADDAGALFIDRCSPPLLFAGPQPIAACDASNRFDRPFWRTATGDLNGDGAHDLYGWSLNEDGCVVYGDGAGGFVDARPVPHDGYVVEGALIADFDGDGNGDLLRVERSYADDALVWHRFFFGPGMLRLPRIARGTIPLISGGEVITVMDDRTVVAAKADGTQRVLRELPDGLPGPTRVAAIDGVSGELLLLTEIDGVEHPLLLDGEAASVEAGVHLGHGLLAGEPAVAVLRDEGGVLLLADRTLPFEIPVLPEHPERCLLIEDLTGDAIADLIETCSDDRIAVRPGSLADDRLRFGEAQVWTIDYWFWDRPFIFDLDGDGDLDLMGTGESGVVELRINDGGGDFTERITLDLGDAFEFQGIADVDGDGVRELLIYRGGELDLELLRWRTPRQLDGPYAIQDLAHHDPPWREPPLFAVDFPDEPTILVHEDLTGDGLADLLMFTRSGPWPYSADNLLLLENVSW